MEGRLISGLGPFRLTGGVEGNIEKMWGVGQSLASERKVDTGEWGDRQLGEVTMARYENKTKE